MKEIERLDIQIMPNPEIILLKPFNMSEERTLSLLEYLLELPDDKVQKRAEQTLAHFNLRHRSVTSFFEKSYQRVELLVKQITQRPLPYLTRLLIGSYFSMEYSLQSAALFNPSVVLAPNQMDMPPGSIRVYISLRAVGEGHISSLIFKQAVIDSHADIIIAPDGGYIEEAEVIRRHKILKNEFLTKISEQKLTNNGTPLRCQSVLDGLPKYFIYDEVRERIQKEIQNTEELEYINELNSVLWVAESYTEINFSYDSDISERIIFPMSQFERNGIEDVRMVLFENEGVKKYYGTYTAYDGTTILPKILETEDFVHFRTYPLHGKMAMNKNLALFPRKINGKYAMLSRIDGVNIYLMTSDNLLKWDEAEVIVKPRFSWERIQMGVCSSPIETKEGWLIVGHGVGPVREYCLSAFLLDFNDPSIVLKRLPFPLLKVAENERIGYVPNVVYSCGAIIHEGYLIIPYAQSDYSSSFARVKVDEVINLMVNTEESK